MKQQKGTKAERQRARRIRWIVLGVVLALMAAVLSAHQLFPETGKWVGVDALCPFGGLETLYSLLTGDGFIKRTAVSSVILLTGMLAMAVVYRRSFCGTICPLGTLQGIFGAAGRKLFKRRFAVPRFIDRPARYLKYVVLVVFAVWTWQAAELVLRPYDPWAAFAHLTSDELLATNAVGLGVLVVSLLGSFVYDRFFCKYLCPAGALLALISKFSILNIRRDAHACTSCGRCDTACMMNVEVSTCDAVTSAECISCNECVNACPVPGALKVTAPRRVRVPAVASTAIVAAVIVAIVGLTTIGGSFEWQTPTLAETAAAAGLSVEDGTFDTSLIKGKTSLAEIAEATGIPESAFTAEWGVTADELEQPMSAIKDAYGFTPEDVRAWVEARLAE
jgi:polyferredoxin